MLHGVGVRVRSSAYFGPSAGVAKLADAQDLKSCGTYLSYRFDSGLRHHFFTLNIAGWSSLVARRAHNPKVVGSNPAPAIFYFNN